MEIHAQNEIHIALPLFETIVTITGPGAGKISTNQRIYVHSQMSTEQAEAAEKFNNILIGIEALVLSHALAGIDIETREYLDGYEYAIDTLVPSREEILSMK